MKQRDILSLFLLKIVERFEWYISTGKHRAEDIRRARILLKTNEDSQISASIH